MNLREEPGQMDAGASRLFYQQWDFPWRTLWRKSKVEHSCLHSWGLTGKLGGWGSTTAKMKRRDEGNGGKGGMEGKSQIDGRDLHLEHGRGQESSRPQKGNKRRFRPWITRRKWHRGQLSVPGGHRRASGIARGRPGQHRTRRSSEKNFQATGGGTD